mmetsp:Transcript_36080/g.107846  ORF Transcript_36080/g.107846 Transcript_36080/m.107846 type:complete len:278 (-) Transcript_36080:1292-2125(-)
MYLRKTRFGGSARKGITTWPLQPLAAFPWTKAAQESHLSRDSVSESSGSTKVFWLFFRLTQPKSGPSPLTFWYCMRLLLRKSCSILAPVPSLSGSSGDCILSPLRTSIPPVCPPPTTSHMRPALGFHFISGACWAASSLAAARRFAASSWSDACRAEASRSVNLACASSLCFAACAHATSTSSRSLGRLSASPSSITIVRMERGGALTLAAPALATFSQKLMSRSLWLRATTTRVSAPVPWLVKAVTSSASRLVPQTTRRAPGRMKRAKWARYQKAG